MRRLQNLKNIAHFFRRYCVNVKTSGRFFQILCPSQKTSTLLGFYNYLIKCLYYAWTTTVINGLKSLNCQDQKYSGLSFFSKNNNCDCNNGMEVLHVWNLLRRPCYDFLTFILISPKFRLWLNKYCEKLWTYHFSLENGAKTIKTHLKFTATTNRQATHMLWWKQG